VPLDRVGEAALAAEVLVQWKPRGRGGVWVCFRVVAEVGLDGIPVQVIAAEVVVGCVAYAVVGEASLPNG